MNITGSSFNCNFKGSAYNINQATDSDYQDIVNVFRIRDAKQATQPQMKRQPAADTFSYENRRPVRTNRHRKNSAPSRTLAFISAAILSGTIATGTVINSLLNPNNHDDILPENSIVEIDTSKTEQAPEILYEIGDSDEINADIVQEPEIVDEPIFDYEINLSPEQEYSVSKFLENWEKNSSRYETIETATGIPAELVAAIHWREGSGDFNRCLQDGTKVGSPIQSPVDNGKVFNSFEESAISVFSDPYFSSSSIIEGDYDTYLNFAEKYNGFGYKNNGLVSPYVYAGTDQYTSGKFVADGSYDPTCVDQQPGVAVLLEAIC